MKILIMAMTPGFQKSTPMELFYLLPCMYSFRLQSQILILNTGLLWEHFSRFTNQTLSHCLRRTTDSLVAWQILELV
jgi:hypothetical protein